MNNTSRTLATSAAIGVLSGMRSMLPAAVLARSLRAPKRTQGALSKGMAGSLSTVVLTLFAIGELIGDKTPKTPNRTDLVPLFGRIGMAKLCAIVIAQHRDEGIVLPAVVGGGGALIGTFASFHLRRLLTKGLGAPDSIVAVAEDAVVLNCARSVVEQALAE